MLDRTTVEDRLAVALRDGYEVLGEIGRGGMACVYLARDLVLDRFVALKVMAPELLAAPGMVERFLAEARTVARLRHPHVVAIHAVLTCAGLHLFVMEYLEGRTLAAALDAARLDGRWPSLERRIDVLVQVARALQYAHERGVVHRDVKPANIMLLPDDRAVVMDFGIAKVATEAGVTQPGHVLGTPSYMSPEQCDGRAELTGATDQYALGVVAHELITGAPPFVGGAVTVMHAHLATPVPPFDLASTACPAALRDVVLRMLAKAPAERFPTIGEAADALARAVAPPLPLEPARPDPARSDPARPDPARREAVGAGAPGVRPPRRSGLALLAATGVVAALGAVVSAARERAAVPAPSSAAAVPPSSAPTSAPTSAPAGPSPVGRSRAPPATAAVRIALADAVRASDDGEYERAARLLADASAALRSAAAAAPGAPALDSLADALRDAATANRVRCESYARLLAARGRAAPACADR